MHNMISSEMFKIRKSKVTIVMAILTLLWVGIQVGVFVVLKGNDKYVAENGSCFALLGLISFLDGDLLYICVGIFTSLIVCYDYSTGSIRQIISKGKGKVQYVVAQYISIVCYELIFALIYLTLAYIGGAMVAKSFTIPSEYASDILLFFLGAFVSILAIVAIMLFISFLFTKLSVALTINLLLTALGALVFQLLCFVTKSEDVKAYWLTNMSQSFGNFDVPMAQRGIFALILMVCAFTFALLSAIRVKQEDIE